MGMTTYDAARALVEAHGIEWQPASALHRAIIAALEAERQPVKQWPMFYAARAKRRRHELVTALFLC